MFRKKFLGMILLVGMLSVQSVPRALAQTYCDHAQFVSDLTAPDGSAFAPGATFTKTWRLTNIGTCTWTTAYNLVWVGGDSVGAPPSVKLPVDVPPGQMVDVSVNLTAPTTSGHYKALFKINNTSGARFGIGDSASDPFWVDINVAEVSATIYDFVANAPYAQWRSGAGTIPFPGTSGDSRGYAYQINNPHLEDDSLDSLPGLLAVPQNKFNGYIQATYPEFQVQQGDRLQALVNCEFGATGCYATFRIDYLLPNGAQRTLWSWKEAYDRRFYRANLDLSSLAGQRVRFVFMLLSSGFASGDRAIWGSPRIVRTGSTQPPAPPATLTPLPPLPPTATPIGQPTIIPSGCDRASFVTDVTVPDGTIFSPGAAFTKTWRLRNAGSCTWTTSYKLIYYSGEQMSAPTAVNLPWNAAPGQTVDISINMVSPATAAKYRGYWILANGNGQFFGIGADAAQPIWVEINVAGESPIGTGYDFTSNVCSAEWRSTVGILPCPSTDGNTNGFVLKLDTPKLEDGSTGAPGLLTVPQNRFNGYIQGFYPTFTVQPGDKFQATVGCEYGAACNLTYRLDYMTATGYIGTFWTWREQNEGKVYNANIDLQPLAGRSVRFILTILATGSATNDRALWGSPRIARAGGGPAPATITPIPPTITQVPPTNDWPLYMNSTYGFQFKYPPLSERFFETTNNILIRMPIVPGTNLREKYLQMTVIENANPCQSPLSPISPPGSPTETVVFNGIPFFKQIGGDAGAGHHHEWVGYSTLKNNACISMDFVLHSLNGSFPPPPDFDKAVESAVFPQVMSTFAWLTTIPSPTPTSTSLPPTAASPVPTSTPTTPPGPSPTEFAQTIVNTLNLKNFDMAKSLMDQSFMMTFWQSQGTAYTPDLAIEQLRTNYIGASTVLAADPNKDLVALLDGSNPYSKMGLDPTKSQALFVSGWGLDGMSEAILYATRRADGSLYWYGVLIAPGGFARFTPTPDAFSHEAFCADTRIPILIEQLKGSMNQSNGDMFAALASPSHGIDVRLWSYQPAVNFNTTTARTVFANTQVYNWGAGHISGSPDFGTFSEVIQPKLLEVLNATNMETYCDDLTKVPPLSIQWPYPNIRFYNLHKPSTPATSLNFRTWLIGFEYINNEPYLYAMVSFISEP